APWRPSNSMRASEIVSMVALARARGAALVFCFGALGLEILAQLALDDLALDRPHLIDEHTPVQMVGLVLDPAPEQPLAFRLEDLPVGVLGAHAHLHAALHGHEDPGERQAALITRLA